ncbi:RasGEF domain containing protein [Tritrichomonas foetus]|uniref:RasGEF domain containing protein n=1 Tax=Tritrichomonas foetus TaxID=1144522 RepID=A0A1J4J0J7_9EUKA|nr:RasGEF domain containing protein [Tritrichomonas foetus]|eukprot:OHS93158.1 RasGEF domain containing protein [Tritrichomonas foetus]
MDPDTFPEPIDRPISPIQLHPADPPQHSQSPQQTQSNNTPNNTPLTNPSTTESLHQQGQKTSPHRMRMTARSGTVNSLHTKDTKQETTPNQKPASASRSRSPPNALYKAGPPTIFLNDEDRDEQKSVWLNNTLEKSPHFLALRERALPLFEGVSFSNLTHTNTVTALSSINRHSILELIYQHLEAIGMYQTAEILAKESGHQFQSYGTQPWERTNLHLLTSMAIGLKEDAWDIQPNCDPNHTYVIEEIEEDFFSSPYREDPSTIWREFHDLGRGTEYINNERVFSKMKLCSLKRLVVCMLMFDGKNITYDDQHEFFLSLQSITSADHFLEHLVTLFNCNTVAAGFQSLPTNKVKNIQVAVLQLVRRWINFHGLFIGTNTLKNIMKFVDRILLDESLSHAHENAKKIKDVLPKLTYGMSVVEESVRTMIKNRLDPAIDLRNKIIFSPLLTLLGPNPLEVARQISMIYHEKFATIHSLEFIIGMKNGEASLQTPTISEMFVMDEHLAQLVAKTFIEAENKQEAYLKLVDIARKLHDLYNFDSLAVFLRILLRDDVRLLAMPKEATKLENELRGFLEDCGENLDSLDKYENLMIKRAKKQSPAIPNIYTELKKADPNILKQPDFINGLLNWEKIRSLGRMCSVWYRLQNTKYNYWPIPQIQKVIQEEINYPFDDFEHDLLLHIQGLYES